MKKCFIIICLLLLFKNVVYSEYNSQNTIQHQYNNSPTMCSEEYFQRLKANYEEAKQRLQAANPYTRMAEVAPVQALEPIDMQYLKSAQAADRFGTAMAAMNDPNAKRPDYAALRQQHLQELQNAANYNRAVQMANATGLTPEEFIQGGKLNYNSEYELAKQQMQTYEELMLQCLKNMRQQQYNNYYNQP